jgi:hypothetical protein
VKFAFADPPYLGCGKLYIAHHPKAMDWNDPQTHRALVERLCAEYPDGWAMSCHSPSLRVLLPFTPEDCRVGSWVKPFAVFKPNVNPAYAWEPVIFRGGRKRDRTQPTARDWHSENITLQKGLPGAKPPKFADWILALLGVDFTAGDTIDDLFPGTHHMELAWKERRDPTQAAFVP